MCGAEQSTLLTREQAFVIAETCAMRDSPEAFITGEGGDLRIAIPNEENTVVYTFTVKPGGEIEEPAFAQIG